MPLAITEIVCAILLWGNISCRISRPVYKKLWKALNALLFVLSVILILYLTVLRRTAGDSEFSPVPFSTYYRAYLYQKAGKYTLAREMFRTTLMNVLLFLPFGLSLSALLPEKLSIRRRIFITVIAGALFSIGIESAQYAFSLGSAETDDLIMNSVGSLGGALHLALAGWNRMYDGDESSRSREYYDL